MGYWLQWIVSLRAFLSKLDDFPVLSSSTSCHCQCHAGALKKLCGNVRANKLLPVRNPQLDKIAQIGLTWGSEQIYQQNDSIPKETRPVKHPTRGEAMIPRNLNIDISENPHFVFEQVMRFPQTPVLIGWKTRCVCICSNLLLCWRVKLSTLSSCICSTKFLL